MKKWEVSLYPFQSRQPARHSQAEKDRDRVTWLGSHNKQTCPSRPLLVPWPHTAVIQKASFCQATLQLASQWLRLTMHCTHNMHYSTSRSQHQHQANAFSPEMHFPSASITCSWIITCDTQMQALCSCYPTRFWHIKVKIYSGYYLSWS